MSARRANRRGGTRNSSGSAQCGKCCSITVPLVSRQLGEKTATQPLDFKQIFISYRELCGRYESPAGPLGHHLRCGLRHTSRGLSRAPCNLNPGPKPSTERPSEVTAVEAVEVVTPTFCLLKVPDLGRASIWTMLAFEAAMQSRESALRKVEDKRPKEQHTTSADPPLVKPEAPDQLRQRMAWALAQALGVGGL